MGRKRIYALYKGDAFIDMGTKEHLAKLLNVETDTIIYYSSPSYLKKGKGNAYIVIKVEDDEEWNQLSELNQN